MFAFKFAGTVYGISSTIANMTGFLTPQVVGWLTSKEVNDNVSDW